MNESEAEQNVNAAGAEITLQELATAFDERREQIMSWIRFRMDSRLAGRVDLEDVLQESYMAASTRWKHFPRDGSVDLIVWIRSIVLQTLTDLHRVHIGAQCRDARREIGLPTGAQRDHSRPALADQLVADLTSPSLAAARREMSRRIQDALETMSETDQEILMLRHFDMLDNHEVAQVLGITAKNASIRYVRALKRLKPLLEAAQGEDTQA
ncbi:MAG: sigma-70 family RNA polymerase sigma factor [Planctomycetales bacterium]|nr:sigma-70 family RNA polymerase sigma factor [Planctomycetales bacterium]